MSNRPPQDPDFLNIMPLQVHVTFEVLEAALKEIDNAFPPSFCIGVMYGSVCAPHMVTPSMYLPHILGQAMELPDPETAQRVLSLLHSLHNQLAAMIEDHLPLTIRRAKYELSKDGFQRRGGDLWQEVFGFRKGLSLGTYRESDMPTRALDPYEELADEQDSIRAINRRISLKRKPYTEKEGLKLMAELDQHGENTARLMRKISHLLYLQRVNKYKAQGVIRVGRNDPCPCGSGKKFKICCMDKVNQGNPGYN